MSRAEKTIATLVTIPVAVVALVAVAWGISYWRLGDHVAANVSIAGTDVGGLTPSKLDKKLDEIADRVSAMTIDIKTPDGDLRSTAEVIGMSLDKDTTRRGAMAIGRGGRAVERPYRWLTSLFDDHELPATVRTNAETLAGSIIEIEGDQRTDPVEPTMDVSGDHAVLVAGSPGSQLTLSDVVSALPSTINSTKKAIRIDVEPTEVPTKVSDAQVQELVDTANKILDTDLEIKWADKSTAIPGSEFRPALSMVSDSDNGSVRLALDGAHVDKVLSAHTDPSGNPTGVKFDIVNGVPTPVGGSDTQICCGADAPDLIINALLAGTPSVELPTRPMTAEEGRKWAAGLGVKQVIGEFTTRHACCQSRVTNIHRIADIMRGVLIAPGDTISVNGIVGRRTTEKGFVSGGVILDGEHTTDVGGGVSQFATTTFNAAFFAGLDIPAYQSHSEWLSRYPFGRDATLWYPSVDLKIHNNTPYGVVVWTSYTSTSVTVQMWSTPYVKGEQIAQSPTSGCGRITTTRKRTWTDGRTETDKFYSNYRC